MRFLVAGAVNTALSLLLYWLLLLVFHSQVAYAASYAAGIVLSYLLNTRFVFRVGHSWRKLLLFPAIYFFTYGVGALMLHISIVYWQFDARLAPLVSIAATTVISFLLIRAALTGKADR